MKVRAIKTFTSDISMQKGEERELDAARAEHFKGLGLVEEVKKKPVSVAKQDASAAKRSTKEEKNNLETK